jgi:putative iron-regulated protein
MIRRIMVGVALSLSIIGIGHASVQPEQVVKTYADIALAAYQDALITARELEKAILTLLDQPDEQTLKAARAAWINARAPYQQTEAFRFGNPVIEDWEGRVNGWPLDEGMIDYVDASYGSPSDMNAYGMVNVIANKQLNIGGRLVDVSAINEGLLSDVLHGAGGNEANVATGYHVIEFLLWGQDVNGTGPAPADRTGTPQERHSGNRPHTDFDPSHCTGGQCERRGDYLKVAVRLLVDDLEDVVELWQEAGQARQDVVLDPRVGLSAMLTGLGSLSYGELAGERMKLGLLLNDAEGEQDDFSDNTHNAHFYNQVGMMNVYNGRYKQVDGAELSGASLAELVKRHDANLDKEMQERLVDTYQAMQAIKHRAETVETYDQMLAKGNIEGNALIQTAIDRLVAQTRTIERIIAALELSGAKIEGSDSLDNPEAVLQ